MPLHYPGIDIPNDGLTISISKPWRGARSEVVRQGRGWLRLIVRATQAPALRLDISSNTEALPHNCADVSLGMQHEFTSPVDERLSFLDLTVPMSGATSRITFWSEPLDLKAPLQNVRLRVLARDEDSAQIDFTAQSTTQDPGAISIAGRVRLVAPDSVSTRTASAPHNKGWLALPNDRGTINGDWDLTNGDLDELPPSLQVLAVDLENNARIDDVGLRPLSRLPNLQKLTLSGTAVTGIGFKALERLPRLRDIEVNHTPMTDAGPFYLRGHQLTAFGANRRWLFRFHPAPQPRNTGPIRNARDGCTDVAFASSLPKSGCPED